MAEQKLLPDIPVLTEYLQVKEELTTRIAKLNAITELTEDNKKEVKSGIAEINKVKDRIARYRIDQTNEFLKYIEPYTKQCKELEEMCTKGLADIKSRVADLEEKERQQKINELKNKGNLAEANRLKQTNKSKGNIIVKENIIENNAIDENGQEIDGVDKMITYGKDGSLVSRRKALAFLNNDTVVVNNTTEASKIIYSYNLSSS